MSYLDTGSPLLSIVTVTFNDLVGLRRTRTSIAGLLAECGGCVEWIVKDGGTANLPEDFVDEFANARLVSGKDGGVYDAMNLAAGLSKGKYIWFLNGGDESLISSEKLLDILRLGGGQMLLFDYIRHTAARDEYRTTRPLAYLWHALPTSHQAILFPGEAARALRYDLSYEVAADYEFTAQMFRAGIGGHTEATPLARFHTGGMSTAHRRRIAHDATRVQMTVLRSPWPLVWASRMRHILMRVYRDLSDWVAPVEGGRDQ